MIKRLFDITLSSIGLFVSAPLWLAIPAAIKLEDGGSIMFPQERVGKNGRVFKALKFRSMVPDAEAMSGPVQAREGDPRVTRIGGFLRKYRLDELPQFINVIRGDMSFVGTRPERPVFVEMLRKEISYYDERHSARPGLTAAMPVRR